jgi:hypothetical protein
MTPNKRMGGEREGDEKERESTTMESVCARKERNGISCALKAIGREEIFIVGERMAFYSASSSSSAI